MWSRCSRLEFGVSTTLNRLQARRATSRRKSRFGPLETRDVERVATGMLAPAMLAAGLAPARIGADLAHEPDTLAEMGEGSGLHVLAREGVELPREAAAHQTRGAPGDARAGV